MARGKSHKNLAKNFCSCIKKVRKTVKLRGQTRDKKQSKVREKEAAAIAICVRSVLKSRGRTLRKFKCDKKPYLETQSPFLDR